MPVTLDFIAGKDFDFAKTFAERFHQPISNHKVQLPAALGKGYIQEIYLSHGISLCLHKYHLHETLELNRLESGTTSDMLTVKFTRNLFFSRRDEPEEMSFYNDSYTAEVSTGNLFGRVTLPGGGEVDFLVITLSRKALAALLRLDADAPMHNTILHNPSFVFYESAGAGIETVLLQVQAINGEAGLRLLQYEARVYELLYLLFSKLLSREAEKPLLINQTDADKIYTLQKIILEDLSQPPSLPQLAKRIGMSETKMKKLFRYVFGQSVYNYFQLSRMNEAARLLSKLSVSETGYQLGFTNLSHFSRLFEKHFHAKPKQYQSSLAGTSRDGFQRQTQ